MSMTSPVAAVEVVDQAASETLEPATEALDEQGESIQLPPPKTLVLPLTERLLVGAFGKKYFTKCVLKADPKVVLTGKGGEVEEVSTKVGDLRESWFNVLLEILHCHGR